MTESKLMIIGVTRKALAELLRSRMPEVPAEAYLQVYEDQEADDDVIAEFRWTEPESAQPKPPV